MLFRSARTCQMFTKKSEDLEIISIGKIVSQKGLSILQNRLAPKLFTPRRPKLAAKRIQHQESTLPSTSSLLTNTKVLAQRRYGVGVDTGVEVHGDLDPEDGREQHPLLPPGPCVAEEVGAFLLCDNSLSIWALLTVPGLGLGAIVRLRLGSLVERSEEHTSELQSQD